MKVKELIKLLAERDGDADVQMMIFLEHGSIVVDVVPIERVSMMCDEKMVNVVGTKRKIISVP